MRHLFIALALFLPMQSACVTPAPAPIEVNVVDGIIEKIVSRHDVYVFTDLTLDPGEVMLYLDESQALLNLIIDTQYISRVSIAGYISVLDRHDHYAANELDSLKRRVYLRSSNMLRGLITTANSDR
jgi:hypothetical protein